MFKILIFAIFLMGNAFGGFNISNIKLSPTELEIVGDSLEDIQSVTIVSKDSSKEFEIENLSSNQVIARPLDTTVIEGLTLNLVISDSLKEETYPITISQKNGLVTFYKLQEKESDPKPVVNSQNKVVLGHESEINFLPGENSTGYDYNYSLYANPTGDFAIKGVDKDLFTIDNQGNVEISGTLKIKGKQIGFNIPYLPIKEQTIPSDSANKVVFSSGQSKELVESGYTIPMNICPKGQILKSDGINFVCSLEASQEEQLGPVYTNQKSNFGIDQIYRELQINNVIITATNDITGVVNFTSIGNMDVATGTFHVSSGTGVVGIGIATPTYKLDIQGATNSGIRLKQAALISTNAGGYFNGMVIVDPTGDSFGIGASTGNTFWINSFDGGTYRNIFSINGVNGNGAILGNLKIGAYTLPAADGASNTVLRTDGAGVVSWSPVVAGSVNGPGTTVVGNIATWNNLTGTLLADGNKVAADLVTNAASSTNGFVATFSGVTGKIIQNGTKLEADLVTGPASASSTNLASFSNATGKQIQDSGIISTNVMTMTSAATSPSGGNVLSSVIGTRTALETTISISTLPTMALVSPKLEALIVAAGTDRSQKATAYKVPYTLCPSGNIWKSDGTDMICSTAAGGDVVGPATSTINNLTSFADNNGKILKDSGIDSTSLPTMAIAPTAPNQMILSGAGSKQFVATPYTVPATIGTVGHVLTVTSGTAATWATPTVSGDVVGPATATFNALARYGASGKIIVNSSVILSDTGDLTGITSINTKTAADLVTMPTPATATGQVMLSSAAGKVLAPAPYTFPTIQGTTGQVLKLVSATDATWQTVGGGDVVGQGTSAPNEVAVYADSTGKLIRSVSISALNIVQNTATPTVANHVAVFDSTTGKSISDSGKLIGDLVTGPAGTAANSLASYNGLSGKIIQDSGIAVGNVVTMSATPTTADRIYLSNAADKTVKTSSYIFPATNGTIGQVLAYTATGTVDWATPPAGNVAGPATSTTNNFPSFADGLGKNLKDSGISSTNVVQNPAASTDNAVARFDLTSGKLIQNSVVTIDDAGVMSGVTQMNTGGTFTITGDMNVTGNLTAQSYTNTSDRNLKKDITALTGGGDLIDKLMPVTFRWKKGDDRPVIGLIAQDVEKVLPDAITITKGKDGAIRSYDLGQVLALTIEALKETRAQVKTLEEKIKKLEQKNRKKGE